MMIMMNSTPEAQMPRDEHTDDGQGQDQLDDALGGVAQVGSCGCQKIPLV